MNGQHLLHGSLDGSLVGGREVSDGLVEGGPGDCNHPRGEEERYLVTEISSSSAAQLIESLLGDQCLGGKREQHLLRQRSHCSSFVLNQGGNGMVMEKFVVTTFAMNSYDSARHLTCKHVTKGTTSSTQP